MDLDLMVVMVELVISAQVAAVAVVSHKFNSVT